MAFSRIKPAGWAFGEILTSAHLNSLDTDHAKAIDGTGGGTYALATSLTLNTVSVPAIVATASGTSGASSNAIVATTAVGSTGVAIVASGPKAASFSGQVVMDSSGASPHQLNGATEIPDGSGVVTFLGTGLPALASRTVVRLQDHFSARPASTKWGYATGLWIQNDVSISELLDFSVNNLIDKASLVSLTITLSGGSAHAGLLPQFLPAAQAWSVSATGFTAISALVTDPSASAVAYDAIHTLVVPLTTPITVNESLGFALRMSGESGTNSVANGLRVVRVSASFTVTSLTPGG